MGLWNGDSTPDYHDVFITTDYIPRTALSDLHHGIELTCNRVGGWCLWTEDGHMLGGEYSDRGLKVEVGDFVVVDSLSMKEVQNVHSK